MRPPDTRTREFSSSRVLPPDFFSRPAVELAPELLGVLLVRQTDSGITSGRIVETEAYPGPEDPASHAALRIGRTRRNDPLFGPPGTAYVHCNYGVHWCFNVVAARSGKPEGVLVRAVEPVAGIDLMRERRGREELTNGPGRLGQAFALGPDLNGHPLDRPPIWLEGGDPVPTHDRVSTTRIGIRRAAERPWRWYDGRSKWVSRR
ncbi:MAG: DNA-3-methyladenine glycosylase [marine benthic group bacterium]|nr:DNA-3-methyladenine glycosylase [Gemmatimonadota bacterium]